MKKEENIFNQQGVDFSLETLDEMEMDSITGGCCPTYNCFGGNCAANCNKEAQDSLRP
jgi:hypothetical protein